VSLGYSSRAPKVLESNHIGPAASKLKDEILMRPLSKKEINRMLMQGRMLSEREITSMLDEFQEEQPEIYQAIFGDLSDAIVEENQDMADLFLDLCCDIIWIYRKAFGKPPQTGTGDQSVLDSLSLLDTELKSLFKDIPMNEKLRLNLQERFVKRSVEAGVQMELLEILDTEVKK
jgi:hypothetical protein